MPPKSVGRNQRYEQERQQRLMTLESASSLRSGASYQSTPSSSDASPERAASTLPTTRADSNSIIDLTADENDLQRPSENSDELLGVGSCLEDLTNAMTMGTSFLREEPASSDGPGPFSEFEPRASPPSESSGADEETLKLFQQDNDTESLLLALRNSPSLCLQLLNAQDFVIDGWCKLSTKVPNQFGYVRVSGLGRGGKDLLSIHQLAMWSEGRYAGVPDNDNPPQDASHLCGHPTCFNPDHLVWEGHTHNLDRRGCVVWVNSPTCPNCSVKPELKINVCRHADEEHRRCIKYCEGYKDNFGFEANGLLIQDDSVA